MRGTNRSVLGEPNNREHAATVRAALAGLSSRFAARLAPDVVRVGPDASGAPGAPGAGWVGVDALLADGRLFPRLVRSAFPRFGSDDRALVGAQLVREWVSTVTTAAVAGWGRDRRVFDWAAGNVAVRADGSVGLRGPRIAVLGGDPLAGDPLAGRPSPVGPGLVTVASEARLVERVLDGAIGHPVRSGARPGGAAAQVPAVAAVVAAARRATRSGARHYWGTVGLAVVNGLTAVSHDVGPRADRDRALLLRHRPDLARTVELVTTGDGAGGTVSCGRRLTCCLLVKLPGAVQCGTCNLRDRDECVASVAAWARGQRADRRAVGARGT
jgi:hypothetical protein